MTKITKEDIAKCDSITSMKLMIEKINCRMMELDKAIDASGYKALETEKWQLEMSRESLDRTIVAHHNMLTTIKRLD